MPGPSELTGRSPAITALRGEIDRLLGLARTARRLPPILIQGETGTGKNVVARLFHERGPRAGRPFIHVNCPGIPESMPEGALFGHVRGAFTGAVDSRPGHFQRANGGILLLDEVGALSDDVQAKILVPLQERKVTRVGGMEEPFDAWIISATKVDLATAVAERRFREDLYHRLAGLVLHLPPLRERGDDIVLLADRFLEHACREYGVPGKTLSAEARGLIMTYPWPGNVRQLGNVMERLALLHDRREVSRSDLEAVLPRERPVTPQSRRVRPGTLTREQLVEALETTGSILGATRWLGVSRNTVRAHMRLHGLRDAPARGTVDVQAAAPPALQAVPVTPPVAAPAPRRERRHVTVLRAALASDDAGTDSEWLLSLAAERAIEFGGRVESLGHSALDVSFGVSPVSDPARRAIGAALAMHRPPSDTTLPPAPMTTVVHTALATVGQAAGVVKIDEGEHREIHDVLTLLGRGAVPGTVRVTGATAPFVARHFELRPDENTVPGAPPALVVVRRDPTGVGTWRRLTRFIDREAERQFLRHRWDLARGGRGQVVGLVGDAGAGKSRLLLEFTRELEAETARVMRIGLLAADDPSRRAPAAALLCAMFDLDTALGAAAIRDRVDARLDALDLERSLATPLCALLEIDIPDPAWDQLQGPQRARRMLDALRRLVVRESRDRAMVLVLEDLHWIDPDTQVALDALIEVVPTARLLVLPAYRPEYRHRWGDKTFYASLSVDALPDRATTELLDELLGEAADLQPLKKRLASETEGNPFFVEERVRMLAEGGAIAGDPGAYRLTGAVMSPALPATIEDTLAARIHQLPVDVRHVLQCAASIGTHVPVAILTTVVDLPGEALERALRTLEDAEFLYPDAATPEPAYTFKHALTHLVAYGSIAPERQRALHGRALTALEMLAGEEIDAHAETLAEHAERAAAWKKAVTYLRRAGQRALARSANRTAAGYFERALVALQRTGSGADVAGASIDLRLELRHALTPLGEVDTILHHLRAAEADATRIGDAQRLGRVTSLATNALFSLGDYAGAIECGGRALAIARTLGDVPMAIAAEQFIGRALHAQGQFREALATFRRVVAAVGPERATENLGLPVPPAVFSGSHTVWCLTEMGEFEEAQTVGAETLRLAEMTNQPEALQWACYALGLLALERGDAAAAMNLLERVRAVCIEADLPVYLPRTNAALGHSRVLAGRQDGLDLAERAAEDAERRGQVNVATAALLHLAEACFCLGRLEEAGDAANRAAVTARQRGQRGFEARALRLQACVDSLVTPPRTRDADRRYRDALQLSETLVMLAQAARCRLELGMLCARVMQIEPARGLLRRALDDARQLGLSAVATAAANRLAELGPPHDP